MMSLSVVPRKVNFSEGKEEKQFLYEYLVIGEFNVEVFFLEALSLFLLTVLPWALLSLLSQRNILECVSRVRTN